MLFDSHCHLNHPDFESDWQDIIADCLNKQIGLFIVGDNFESSRQAVEMSENYPDEPVYVAIGIHPDEFENEEFDEEQYNLLITDKVKAIGEIGLDYFTNNSEDTKVKQKEGFKQQLDFAKELKLPVILHARSSKEDPQDAYVDMLEILSEYNTLKGVIHCFGSTKEIAKEFVDMGYLVGFTGIITFTNKSADPLREVVKSLPLDKILVETDAPFLSPEPHRGERCMPQYVKHVAEKVGEIKEADYSDVADQTTENINTLFM